MPSVICYSRYLIAFCRVFIVAFLLASTGLAQDASNRRGFQPGNSFAIGDIETINTTNGNLMLRFPLGGLPAGRNGLSAGINLYYNSKLYDSETAYFGVENQSCQIVGSEPGILVCPYYQKTLLKESPDGGWRFGMGYSLKLIDRRDQFLNMPNEIQPQCWNPNIYGGSPGYFEMRYHYKLMLIMPDGSSHEMRPNGWNDGNFNDPLGDWFDIRPDGYWFDCVNPPTWYTGPITYYSIDGSYLRLDIQHDSNTEPMDNPWTLYFPDGGKVTSNQPNSEPQRFYDRNNNFLEFLGSEIRDQFNRSIGISNTWENGLPVHTVTSQGFGQTLTWTIHWKWISVLKNYWPCAQTLGCDPHITQQEPYGTPRVVVDSITMPAQAGGLTYQFQYNAPNHIPGQPLSPSLGWGEISGITLPSGAQVSYQYAQDGPQTYMATPDILQNAPTSKVLTYDEEYDGISTPITETWSYAFNSNSSMITAPDGGVTENHFGDTGGAFWNSGLTIRTINPDGTKTETIWERNNLANNASTNPYPKTVYTSIKNGAGVYVKTAIKDYKYDKNGNVTRVAEYDWVDYDSVPRSFGMPTGVPAVSPARVTVSTYYNATPDATQFAGSNTNVYWSSGSPRVKNAIESMEVRKIMSGGGESPVTRVEYGYDNPSAPANLTELRSWDSTRGVYTNSLTLNNWLLTTTAYNQYGMPTLTTDPRGLKTLVTYGPIGTLSDLYPTEVKTAYQTAQVRTQSSEYDLGTGLVTRITDVDNNVSTSTSFDALGRPLLVTAAEGKPEETRTAYEYSDTQRRVTSRADLNTTGDGKLVSIQHYDQLGRIRLSRQLEDASTQSATDETSGIKVQTRYRFSGANSYVVVSNPYRAATSNAAGTEPTMGWTRSTNDSAGRIVEVQTFGGVALPAPWESNSTSTGTVTTVYDANFTTVFDQMQKQRRSVTDALGRLIRVDEPNLNGELGSTTSPNQPTHYTYDVLGNLIQVIQSDGTTTQQRNFVYSSLSRLIQATNPESGAVNYKYDESGNLVVKTDARGVSTHYAYDVLNRVTRRWYNDDSAVSAVTHAATLPGGAEPTSEVKFYYDTLPNIGGPSYSPGASVGRLVAQTYGSGTNGDYFAYDNLGRVSLKYQQTGTVNYQFSATYNRSGAVTSLTYPSGHTVSNSFDQAGRLSAFSGNLGDGAVRTYSTSVLYSPAGAMVKEQFGTNTAIYNKLFYNSRGQLTDIRTSTSYTGPTDTDANRGGVVNYYSGTTPSDNNGNLRKQEILVPGQPTRVQEYEYDSLNRLSSAIEKISTDTQWSQTFGYDRWGNRTIISATGSGINNKEFTINPTNNRYGVPSQQTGVMQYDAAGNLTNDTYTGNGLRNYDAENKMTSAVGLNGQTQTYVYDGTGQRIKRIVGGVETWQVYGIGGELLAEYPVNGAAGSPQKEYGYRNGQLLVTADAVVAPTNVALASNGATATASSAYDPGVCGSAAVAANDGDRTGRARCTNRVWNDAAPPNTFPDWLQIDFNGNKTITEIDVVTIQDHLEWPVEPTEAMTFSLYGLTAFEVQYWQNSTWVTIPGGSVSGNNKVWRKFTFPAINTSKIRVLASASVDGYSRIVELEAWTGPSPAPRYDLALGATTTASTSYPGWGSSAVVNGDRKSLNAYSNGAWSSSAANNFPEWVQVDFGATKTISEIHVFTLQDSWANSSEPTSAMTFTQFGLSGYEVQYWTGSSWVTVPGGSVTGNNKIWRTFTFSPISTSKIRVLTHAAPDGASRVTEIEAYGPADTGGSSAVHWLVADHLGTPRIIFDQSGDLANVRRHDYAPFGEELLAGGRASDPAYGGDAIRQQLTLKERDVETGLDYFLARYYSSTHGRFTSVDPDNAEGRAEPSNPQGWNAYSYVTNSPLNKIDPDGRSPEWLQKIKNALAWGKAVTNAQLAEEVKQKKEELKAKLVEMDGHKYTNQEIDNMTYRQVFWTYDRYRLGIDAGVAKMRPPDPVAPVAAPVAPGNSYVIGKTFDLSKPDALRPGESKLDLPNRGNPRTNWEQNASRLREAMRQGQPIRDASVNPNTGALRDNTGFLRAERNLLETQGWRYNPATQHWHPPGN